MRTPIVVFEVLEPLRFALLNVMNRPRFGCYSQARMLVRSYERMFVEKLLTPERNQLTEDIIEACECLKAWWKKELIQQQKD